MGKVAFSLNIDDFVKSLNNLSSEVRSEVAPLAVKRGAKLLKDAVSQNAPTKSGGYSRKRGKDGSSATGRGAPGKLKASIKHKALDTPGRATRLIYSKDPVAHLIEFGHDLVKGGKKNKGGRVIGKIAPKPGSMGYFRKAIEEQKEPILIEMQKTVRRRLKQIAKRG